MKKLLVAALVMSVLILNGCSNAFRIGNSQFIFTDKKLKSRTVEEMRSAFTSMYGTEPEIGTNSFTWEKGTYNFYGKNVQSAKLNYTGDKIDSIIYVIGENISYENVNDPYTTAIDSALSWFEKIEKELNTKGTVYIGTSEWNDPYSNYSFYKQANDARKLAMQLDIISGNSILQWKSDNRYVKYTYSYDSYAIEAGITLQ